MALAVALELVACVLLVSIEGVAHAAVRPIPEHAWTIEARNTLATVLAVEGCNEVDRRAIPFVLARRWRMQRRGWSFARQIFLYSTPLRTGRVKVRMATNEERVELDAWARGEVADPCGAVHFASRSIVPLDHPLRVCPNARNIFLRGR